MEVDGTVMDWPAGDAVDSVQHFVAIATSGKFGADLFYFLYTYFYLKLKISRFK